MGLECTTEAFTRFLPVAPSRMDRRITMAKDRLAKLP
jgi:hypothetical protein